MNNARTSEGEDSASNPSVPWSLALSLTKPVHQATQRATPPWISWMLGALPSLSLLGAWLMGRFPLFQIIALALFVIAWWDWHRFFDRSRTILTLLGLSAGLIIAATVASIVSRPEAGTLGAHAIWLASLIALCLALVQLYRSQETVLILVRGWIFAMVILTAITAYQRVTRDLPVLNGPFPSPVYLAGSMVVGVLLAPIGHALEVDRRLRPIYPLAAILATGVVWTTHRSVALGCCIGVLLIWLATYRWIIAVTLTAIAGCFAAILHEHLPLRWSEVGMAPPLDASIHARLLSDTWTVLVRSHFIGVGPGGIADQWPEGKLYYIGPYSAFLELAAQYGLAISIATACALIAVASWCVKRLWRTRGTPITSPERAPAFWLLIMVVSLPLTTSLQATWLDFPLSTLAAAMWAMLARHVESPQGRALVWSGNVLPNDTTTAETTTAGSETATTPEIAGAETAETTTSETTTAETTTTTIETMTSGSSDTGSSDTR